MRLVIYRIILEFGKIVNELKGASAKMTEKEKFNYMLTTLPESYSYIGDLRPCETQISISFKSIFKRLFGKRRRSSAPYMLILYSDFFFSDDSIGIFMRYPCLKVVNCRDLLTDNTVFI